MPISKRKPMMIRITVLTLLFAILLTACDSDAVYSPENETVAFSESAKSRDEPDMLVIEVRGGSAGVDQKLRIAYDGRAVLTDNQRPGLSRIGQIDMATIDSLRTLAAETDSGSIDYGSEATGGGPGPDEKPLYTLAFDGETDARSVRADETSFTDNSRSLIWSINNLFDDLVQNTPAMELFLSDTTIAAGAAVKLKLAVRNDTERAFFLQFDSGRLFDFSVWSVDAQGLAGEEIWRWGAQQVFNQIRSERKFAPGETLAYAVTWNGIDEHGRRLPGQFFIRAEFNGMPGGSPEQKKIIITDYK
jgi:hypothetical protein